jgi:hypothetical protein
MMKSYCLLFASALYSTYTQTSSPCADTPDQAIKVPSSLSRLRPAVGDLVESVMSSATASLEPIPLIQEIAFHFGLYWRLKGMICRMTSYSGVDTNKSIRLIASRGASTSVAFSLVKTEVRFLVGRCKLQTREFRIINF